MDKICSFQGKTLEFLRDKMDDFYLGGGTALSRYYFNHRLSFDLDFFMRGFNIRRIDEVIGEIENWRKRKVRLVGQNIRREAAAKVRVYQIPVTEKEELKIDFIEDYLEPLKLPRKIDGIFVLSLEDIYIRKIYTIIGTSSALDDTGRRLMAGGRQEAKDFCDIYFLSHTFMGLADFASQYLTGLQIEGLIHWYRRYDRMAIKTGLLELKFSHRRRADYNVMERSIKKEIGHLVEREVEFL